MESGCNKTVPVVPTLDSGVTEATKKFCDFGVVLEHLGLGQYGPLLLAC